MDSVAVICSEFNKQTKIKYCIDININQLLFICTPACSCASCAERPITSDPQGVAK